MSGPDRIWVEFCDDDAALEQKGVGAADVWLQEDLSGIPFILSTPTREAAEEMRDVLAEAAKANV